MKKAFSAVGLFFCINLLANEPINQTWPFVCTKIQLKSFFSDRFFAVAISDDYPMVLANTKSISIDKQNKTIKVMTIALYSEKTRQEIKEYTKNYGVDFSNAGYEVFYDLIDYQNMKRQTISSGYHNCDGRAIFKDEEIKKWKEIGSNSIVDNAIKEIAKKYDIK